jgi:hypothetical protein
MQGSLYQDENKRWYIEAIYECERKRLFPLLPESLITERCVPGKTVEFTTVNMGFGPNDHILQYARIIPKK